MCVIYSIVAMRKGGECDRGWDGSRGEPEDDMIVFLRCLKGRGGQGWARSIHVVQVLGLGFISPNDEDIEKFHQ